MFSSAEILKRRETMNYGMNGLPSLEEIRYNVMGRIPFMEMDAKATPNEGSV